MKKVQQSGNGVRKLSCKFTLTTWLFPGLATQQTRYNSCFKWCSPALRRGNIALALANIRALRTLILKLGNFKRGICNWQDPSESVIVIRARSTGTADYFEVGLSTFEPLSTSTIIYPRCLFWMVFAWAGRIEEENGFENWIYSMPDEDSSLSLWITLLSLSSQLDIFCD